MSEVRTSAVGLSLALRHAEHAVRARIQPHLEAEDLTVEHGRILAVLRIEPGLTMSMIAESAVVPAATLTRLVDRLVESALVLRRVDPADKRRVVVALSSRGAALADRLAEAERALEDDLRAVLGDERAEALLRDLALLPHIAG
ncbi:MarR family transcriptional regulator [Nocardioides phosphati]|uniref:MarR family transcriptional regulator n=1 Tax=Nocardioides phosphati TaxID=1867775 RepID=A0ABQ2ND15_9ACTN|nr:MarR family transcriptional regulator [Nocardioides phosphati]GGO91866.1 MarR family transcriptional regulator [Nocardioides phosphati]